jgi:hypothetical protein
MNADVAKSAEHLGMLEKMSVQSGRRELCKVLLFGGMGALLSACRSGAILPSSGVSVEQVVRGKDTPGNVAATSAADQYELADIESLLGI